MARFYNLTTDVVARPYRGHQGPGVVKVGSVASIDPTSMPSLISVGLTDMDIEINPNIESAPLRSAQLFNPWDVVVTGWGIQVNLSLDTIDQYQLALAWSYDVTATITGSSLLALGGQNPSPFRACRVMMEGPSDTGDEASKSDKVMNFDFWKTKWIGSGGFTLSPTTKTVLPLTVHALGNSADNVGQVWTSYTLTQPAYD